MGRRRSADAQSRAWVVISNPSLPRHSSEGWNPLHGLYVAKRLLWTPACAGVTTGER